jgi:hypothetical protein
MSGTHDQERAEFIARIPSEQLIDTVRQFQEQLAQSISLQAAGTATFSPPTPPAAVLPPAHIQKLMDHSPSREEIEDYARCARC